MNEEIVIPESTSVAVAAPPIVPPAGITAAQAKVDAVANLTMKAYERASLLDLTTEETAALQADFPDEAFKPGAAGKEHLIYIEHAFLRDRLNQVIGCGKWALVPRSRWAEDFRTFKGGDASRVYVEAMLLIRGCFVSESVGEMVYYKNNDRENYGDAVEGAKTAALRRCCKELGIGLQAWKKDFGEGWWARRRVGKPTPPSTATPPVKTPPDPVSAPKTELPKPDEATRMRALNFLKAAPGQGNRGLFRNFLLARMWIKGDQEPEDWPLEHVPTGKKAILALAGEVEEFGRSSQSNAPEEAV